MNEKVDYASLKIDGLSPEELFTHLIDSELVSMMNKTQGEFYYRINFHPYFKKTMASSLKGVDDHLIVDVIYHCLRNNAIFKFNKKFYPLFLKAVEKLLPDLAENAPYICGLNRFNAFILFGIKDESDLENLYKNSLEDFLSILDFINKANSYTAYPYMRKKHDKLSSFLINLVLMSRVREGILFYNEFKKGISLSSDFPMTMAASLILLLKDTNNSSKESLLKLHKQPLDRKIVWVLGSFYKDFNDSPENKNLLADLYTTYPKEWVDEHE